MQATYRHLLAFVVHIVVTATATAVGPVSSNAFLIHVGVGWFTALSHAAQAGYLTTNALRKPWPYRWLEYACTAPAMSCASYINAGGDDPVLMVVILLTGAAAQYAGYMLEAPKQTYPGMIFFAGSALQSVGSGIVALEVLKADASDALLVASLVYLLHFAAFPVAAAIVYVDNVSAENADTLYVILSLSSKVTLLCAAWFLSYDDPAVSGPAILTGTLLVPVVALYMAQQRV